MKSKTESRTENETEKEKVEGLMKPRYRVIADYPMGVFGIGEIIQPDSYGICYVLEGGGYTSNVNKYPAIFEPMNWYEEREEIEMPIYLKSKYTDYCKKVDKYIDNKFVVLKGDWMYYYLPDLLPAIKEEYESYINKNK